MMSFRARDMDFFPAINGLLPTLHTVHTWIFNHINHCHLPYCILQTCSTSPDNIQRMYT